MFGAKNMSISFSIWTWKATSGVHFTLKLEAVGRGVMLCPSITLVLKNSQEVQWSYGIEGFGGQGGWEGQVGPTWTEMSHVFDGLF